MKWSLLILCFAFQSVLAQQSENGLSYLSQYGNEYGISAHRTIFTKTVSEENRVYKIIRPMIGLYGKTLFHTDMILGNDCAKRKYKNKHYWQYGLGIHYIGNGQLMSYSTNFKGEVSDRNYRLNHYFYPNLNLEYGSNRSKKCNYFVQLRFGRKFGFIENDHFSFFGAIGITKALKSATDE